MKLSASLVVMSLLALRSGRHREAAELMTQASVSSDCEELCSSLLQDNGIAMSLSSAFSDSTSDLRSVVESLSGELAPLSRQSLLSDPMDEDNLLSVAGDDDEEDDSDIGIDVVDFEADEEDDEERVSESSEPSRSPIKLTFIVS
jgi:hypothetical protein